MSFSFVDAVAIASGVPTTVRGEQLIDILIINGDIRLPSDFPISPNWIH